MKTFSKLTISFFGIATLAIPNSAGAQEQTGVQGYRGIARGEYEGLCGGQSVKGQVRFDFTTGEVRAYFQAQNFESNTYVVGTMNSDGSVRGRGAMIMQGTLSSEWLGRFRLQTDGAAYGRGEFTAPPGAAKGCNGTWSVTGPAVPVVKKDGCPPLEQRAKRVEADLAFLDIPYAISPSEDLFRKRARLARWSTFGPIDLSPAEQQRAAGQSLDNFIRGERLLAFGEVNDARRNLRLFEDLWRQRRQIEREIKATGCRFVFSQRRPPADVLMDEMYALDSTTESIVIGDVWGTVEVNGVVVPPDDVAKFRLDRPLMIRTGGNSGALIRIGSEFRALHPGTTHRVVPKANGTPDIIEDGAATVNLPKPAPARIQTPAANVRVGGTIFTVSHNPITRTTSVQVEEGVVTVTPTNTSLRTVTLSAGEYVEVSTEAVSRVLPAPNSPNSTSPTTSGAGPTPNVASIDLTGIWVDDTGGGGLYRVRQIGNQFWWTVDGTSRGSYANMFRGTISGAEMTGQWVDLPGSPSLGGGRITLRIESKDRIVKVSASPDYGARVWTRQASSSTTANPGTPGNVVANEAWQYRTAAGSWTGTFTRRGTSDLFDAVYVQGATRHVALERVTIQGRNIYIERLQSSLGELCRQTGTLEADNITYRGTGECGPGNAGWGFILTRPVR